MILPTNISWKVKLIRIASPVVLLLTWIFQITSFSFGVIQPTRSLNILLLFTLVYVVISWLPRVLKGRLDADTLANVVKDANVIFSIYAVALLLFPIAFSIENVSVNHTGLGIIASLIGIPMPYLPRNGIIGIRLPWTKDSDEIWKKTNLLGARILLCAGATSFILGGLGEDWFKVSIMIGIVIMGVSTTWYSYKLYNN